MFKVQLLFNKSTVLFSPRLYLSFLKYCNKYHSMDPLPRCYFTMTSLYCYIPNVYYEETGHQERIKLHRDIPPHKVWSWLGILVNVTHSDCCSLHMSNGEVTERWRSRGPSVVKTKIHPLCPWDILVRVHGRACVFQRKRSEWGSRSAVRWQNAGQREIKNQCVLLSSLIFSPFHHQHWWPLTAHTVSH